MNKLLCFVSLMLFANNLMACDEECRKKAAEEKRGIKIAGYLSKKYCGDIKMDFMTHSIRSLQSYRKKQLVTKHRGGMHNTAKYITQRIDWLQECDDYLQMIDAGRIFKDKKSTKNIMGSLEAITKELNSLVKGATYATTSTEDTTTVAGEKFDRMFSLVEQHKTMLLMKGQYVVGR